MAGEVSIGRVIARGGAAIGAAPLAFAGTSAALAGVPPALFDWVEPNRLLRSMAAAHPFAVALPAAAAVLLGWLALRLLAQAILFRVAVPQLGDRAEPFAASLAGAAAVLPSLLVLDIVRLLAVVTGMALLIVPGLMLATVWAVAAPVATIERSGPLVALARSRALTRGHRWRVFGLLLLGYGGYALASLAVHGVVAGSGTRAPLTLAVNCLLTTVVVVIAAALQASLYVELRDASDGPAADRLSAIFA